MPRKQKVWSKDAGSGINRNTTASLDGSVGSVPGLFDLQESDSWYAKANRAITELTFRDDGWLRIVPHDFGQVVYWKWKYIRGPHAGHYVMWRQCDEGWYEAVYGLWQKVRLVDREQLKPVKDSYFSEGDRLE